MKNINSSSDEFAHRVLSVKTPDFYTRVKKVGGNYTE